MVLDLQKVSASKLLAAIFLACFSNFKVKQNLILTFLYVINEFVLYVA